MLSEGQKGGKFMNCSDSVHKGMTCKQYAGFKLGHVLRSVLKFQFIIVVLPFLAKQLFRSVADILKKKSLKDGGGLGARLA
mmetsp:Transcript_4781/g.8202  ORF Transcript_4781/g.8202 Transcript_4781/m.8202 type:complete len:81 (+) Transcript_4781:54-296(+)